MGTSETRGKAGSPTAEKAAPLRALSDALYFDADYDDDKPLTLGDLKRILSKAEKRLLRGGRS